MTSPVSVTGPAHDLTLAQMTAVLGFELADEQWQAVSANLDPAVIVAGAGSGKTTSMAARVAWLVGSGYARPDEVLGLTFTTKATAQLLTEMRRSVAALDREGLLPAAAADEGDDVEPDDAELGEPQVLTYHAFSARILAEHGIRLGLEPGATVLADGQRQQLAYRLVCRSTMPLGLLGGNPSSITAHLLALDDELAELAVTPERLRDFDDAQAARLQALQPRQVIGDDMLLTSQRRALLAELVIQWRRDKLDRGVVDFADQIRLAGDIVERFPDVVADLRTRFRFVLLDEYQDTSIAQRLLLQRAFGDGHTVLAVGDPCQAIYGWRGASVDNIDNFPRHFRTATGEPASRFTLSQTRRSGPTLLQVANLASETLRHVHTGVGPLQPSPSVDKGSGAVTCALFDTFENELAWLVQQVRHTHAGGVHWSDIAVLCGTRGQAADVDAALRRQGVPTQMVGAEALLAQPAVIDLRSMLALIQDPTANPEFVRLATGPRWRIDARDLAALGDRASRLTGGRRRSEQEDLSTALDDAVAGGDVVEAVSLTEALEDLGDLEHYSPEAVTRFRAMADELHRLRRHVGEPLPDLIWRVIRETGLEVEAALAPPEIARQQQHALAAFVELAAEHNDVDGRQTLGSFLSRLRDAERLDVDLELDVTGPADAVQLLTIHKSKGLEFGYVFVPFVTDGGFPGRKGRSHWTTSHQVVPWPLRDDRTPELASFPPVDGAVTRKAHSAYVDVLKAVGELEDQRVAYVAFTRAEYGLTVTGHWWGPTQKNWRGPGAFLQVIHEACEDGLGQIACWAEQPIDGSTNPQVAAASQPVRWPVEISADYRATLDEARALVLGAETVQAALPGVDGPAVPGRGSGPTGDSEHAVVAEWDLLIGALLEEARARHATDRLVRLPDTVSASLLMRAIKDPEAVAKDLIRPMPRPPAPAARRGTELHAYIESRFGQQSLLDPDDLPGAADEGITSDEALEELKAAFERSPYARMTPVAVEAPFSLVLGGRVVNGRIDAVFDDGRGGHEVIDWKTGAARGVDPVQLALYRIAWAQSRGVPLDQVGAAFVMVATGEVIRPDTSAEVAMLLGG